MLLISTPLNQQIKHPERSRRVQKNDYQVDFFNYPALFPASRDVVSIFVRCALE